MVDLVFTFCGVRELVQTICSGTLSTAMTCLRLPEHRLLVGCDKGSTCFQNVLSIILKIYAKQISSSRWDKAGGEKALKASQEFETKKKHYSEAQWFVDGLCRKGLFLCKKSFGMRKGCKKVYEGQDHTCLQLPDKRFGHYYDQYDEAFLTLDTSAERTIVKKGTFPNHDSV